MQYICKGAIALGWSELCKQDQDGDFESRFMEHMAKHGLSYATETEYMFRRELYLTKDIEINMINSDPKNTFTTGHNKFSTWTKDESSKMLGFRGMPPKSTRTVEPTNEAPLDIPASMDWREKGAVNPVKNQGQCGSCWAFSAVAAIEGRHAIASGTLGSYSEQEIVDCDSASAGCNGGWQSYAFNWVKSNGGLTSEASYPYHAKDGTCNSAAMTSDVTVSGYTSVKAESAQALMEAIATGPTSVTVEADTTVFQHYTSGILNSSACGTSLDHAITAVGYGSEGGQDYYIVRNSWGADWGDQGYIKIATSNGIFGWFAYGICGIQQTSLFPQTD